MVTISNIISFFNRNWVKSLENVMRRHYYPGYQLVDSSRVSTLKTKFGEFSFTPTLQTYYNLFEQIDDYRTDDLKSTDVVLDIGANVGVFTVLAAKKVSQVVAVEPLFWRELDQNVKLNKLNNVVSLACALGRSSTLEISFCNKKEQVQCIDLPTIKKKFGVKPTFLKTDCEGGEWSLNTTDFEGIRAVEAEVHNFGGEDPMEFVYMLNELGFECNYSWTPEKQLMVSARR